MRRTGHYTDCAEHRKTHPRPLSGRSRKRPHGHIRHAHNPADHNSSRRHPRARIRRGHNRARHNPARHPRRVPRATKRYRFRLARAGADGCARFFCGFLEAAGRGEGSVETAISAGAAAADLGGFAWGPLGTLGAEDAGWATRSGAAMRPIAIAAIGGRSVSTRTVRGLRAMLPSHLPPR